jgi:hypothetical protein
MSAEHTHTARSNSPPAPRSVLQYLFLTALLTLASCHAPGGSSLSIAGPKPAASAALSAPSNHPAYAALSLPAYVDEQEGLLWEFQHSTVRAHRNRSAGLLCQLWENGQIKEEIWGQLLETHYRMCLRQIGPHSGVPSWLVRPVRTFPFMDHWTDFTPTLFCNGEIKWAPGQPQMSCGMSSTVNPIASMTGGEFKNGDVLQCRIDIVQKVGGKYWHRSLWSNKITLGGLRQ